MAENEGLILKRLLDIQEDIGALKSKQDTFEKQIEDLTVHMRKIEKACGRGDSFITISKKQAVGYTMTLITAVLGYFGLGGTI